MNRLALALLLLPACSPVDSGWTSVGNPGLFAIRAAPANADVEILNGAAHTTRAAVHPCDGEGEEVELEPVDFGVVQDLPSGDWCAVELALDGLELEVRVPSLKQDSDVVELNVEGIIVSAPGTFTIEPDGEYIFEIGEPDWLDASHFEVHDDEVVFADDAPEVLLTAVELGSAFYEDPDTDSELSDAERSAGPLAAGDPDNVPDSGDSDDTDGEVTPSCGSGANLAFVPFLLLPMGLRRRS